MSYIKKLVDKHRKKREEIKGVLEEGFSSGIYIPFNSGSFAKHTAINTKFDLDLVIPFKKDSFSTIEDMFDEVHDFLYKKYQEAGKATVRRQRVSIGILFNTDEDGDNINIDVVPGRELSDDSYLEDRELNIYFNENHWGFAEGTYTKTNIQAQINHIKGKENGRKIIRLLKIWKSENGETYKSFLLELFTIKTFDKVEVSGNLWDKLKTVMTYIKDNVTKEGFSLVDPGNSNNDVIKTLDSWERENLSDKMKNMVNRVEENAENLKSYFPKNENFEKDEENESSNGSTYGLKGAAAGPSIPSNNQRFGKK
jgi:tRNA nucleotidyltransferase (CCA-adding enzyme)